ncbi:DUF6011 domain-containing protein [Streptomyces canus]|uniref:DUF6011 domain-containing protein n=1 Tax=Streptomyces canus TaxID=58343 RepID=UPI002786D49D|nr:DUF6011 domain-containing protein [Streptomyces canus]MDQ0762040.1 hypothetical protein [Streptomyces canus]
MTATARTASIATNAVKCKGGCGRTLTSAKSIALGYGPTCARRAGLTAPRPRRQPAYRLWQDRCGWCVEEVCTNLGYYGLAYIGARALADHFERRAFTVAA